MLQLLAPWFLPALGTVLLPVVLHLLHKRKRKVIAWGAMQFLRPDQKTQRKTSLRVKDWMLLVLRILCVLAVVAFFLRPQLRLASPLRTPRDVVIVLDTSLSMGQIVGEQSAWASMTEKVHELLGSLRAEDTVRVLLAAEPPVWLTPMALAGTSEGQSQAWQQISDTEPGGGVCHWPEVCTEAVLARAPRPGMNREVVVCTDGQAYGAAADNTAAWTALRDAAQQPEHPCQITILVSAPAELPANLAVVHLEPAREHASAGETILVKARIKNFGPPTRTNDSVRWLGDGKSIGQSTVPPLASNQTQEVEFFYPVPTEPGVHELAVALATNAKHDVLRTDNGALTLIETLDAAEVLVVDGSGRSNPQESDVTWITTALAVDDGTPAVFRARTSGWDEFNLTALTSKTKVVVLANPRPLEASILTGLAHYVRSGGGLWIMLGDQAEQQPAFATACFQAGQGLSPLLWTEATGTLRAEHLGQKVRLVGATHPVTRLLSDPKHSDLDRVKVFRHFHAEPTLPETSQTLLVTADGQPFLAEKPYGAGRVLLQTAPCNFQWADWPKHQAFVVLLHEGLWRLGSASFTKRNVPHGATFVWPLAATPDAVAAPMVQAPDGSQTPAPVVALANGATEVRVTDTSKPGNYTLLGKGIDARAARFVVARETAESDLTPLSSDQRDELAQAGGLTFSEQAPMPGTGVLEQRGFLDATVWCAALAAVCLLMESWLATWLLRRRQRALPTTPNALVS